MRWYETISVQLEQACFCAVVFLSAYINFYRACLEEKVLVSYGAIALLFDYAGCVGFHSVRGLVESIMFPVLISEIF